MLSSPLHLMKSYLIARGTSQSGPFPENLIPGMIASGQLLPDDLCWLDGTPDWIPLSKVFPFPDQSTATPTSSPPPPLPPSPPSPPPPVPSLGDDAGMRILLPVGRSAWAIAAGYLGLISITLIPAPLALIASIIAIRRIKASRSTPKPLYGMGRAIFGLIAGALGTAALLYIAYESTARARPESHSAITPMTSTP
jgi:hypothetical protein